MVLCRCMEPDNNQSEIAVASAAPDVSAQAPRMSTLLGEGWAFIKVRKDLVQWYVVLLVLFSLLSSEWVLALDNLITFAAALVAFVVLIFSTINSWGILFAVSQPDPYSVNYEDAVAWSAKHFLPLLWTTVLVGLATLGGFLLLIIPGIIISLYLQFSMYAIAMGSDYGVPALKQSYHDVKNHWWVVVKKLFALGMWLLLIYLVVGFVLGVAVTVSGEGTLVSLVAEALVAGAGGVISAMGMYAMAQYYKYLRAHPIS
jgi:hypothetical protein